MPQTMSTENTQAEQPLGDRRSSGAGIDLGRPYIVEDPTAVSRFIAENRLEELLQEACPPLGAAFGAKAAKILRLVTDSEGFTTLFCLVSVDGDLERALEAREAFDRTWWLDRCAAAAGKLNFDFEPV